MRARCFIASLTFFVASSDIAAAQSARDFSHLPIKVGDTIFVTDAATGVAVRGPLTALSPAQLSIDGYAFTPASALTIERAGDPIWGGAAVGFALGAFALYPIVPETLVSQGGRIRINNGLMWGAIGALIDLAHKGRTTIYKGGPDSLGRSVRLVPELGSGRKGLALALAF
jgi:hypothetical protein